ncbi:GatB/YqeY domain-containing protein [Streptacidiphilus albus]|uniref:GatB/YqeY domain-containing protein n=1 Tax=Streptacidiphilus albus TaxID=105425 RepID=UPI0009DD91CE|nr:GatB/YqeY domain-containing protein [Streptacidiphilus albus]
MSTEMNAVPSNAEAPLRQRLRGALTLAMKARDRVAVGALRSTLAAIDNAEAVDRPTGTDTGLAIEQIPLGVGAAEMERRLLTESQIERIVRDELAEREAAARDYEQSGRTERAEQLRREVSVLAEQLAG